MAGRVNTKFVFMLSAIIIFMVLALAGVYYKTVLKSASNLAAKGDQLVEENQLFLALKEYGKAVHKEPTNKEYIEKYIALFPKLQIDLTADARLYLNQERSFKKQLAEITHDTTEKQIDYYELLFSYSNLYNSATAANILFTETDEWLNSVPDDIVAIKYRGIAQTMQFNLNTPERDRIQALEDLTAAAKAFPEDADIPYFLSSLKLFECSLLDSDQGNRELAAQYRHEAQQYTDQLHDLAGDNPKHLIRYANQIINPNFIPRISAMANQSTIDAANKLYAERIEMAKPVIANLVEKANANQIISQYDLIKITNLLRRTHPETVKVDDRQIPQGIVTSVQLLESALASKPNNIMILHELGNLYRMQGQIDSSLPFFEKAMNLPNINTAMNFLRDQRYQLNAAKNVAELLIAKSASAKDESEKDKVFASVEKTIDYINKRADSPSLGEILKAKLLYAQNKFEEATPLLEKAYKQTRNTDPQLMQMTAEARLKQNNWGAAIQIYEDYLTVRPTDTRIALKLASLYTTHKQSEKARPIINKLLEIDNTNRTFLLLHATVLAYENQIDKAIEIYKSLDPEKTPAFYDMLTQLYLAKKDTASARESAYKYFEAEPTNLNALQKALSLTDTQDEKNLLIQIAKDAGAEERTLNLIADKQQGKLENLDPTQLASRINEGVDDPFTKLINEIQVYARSNDLDSLRTAIAKAAELEPKHPDVLKLQFNIAITDKKYDAAEQLLPDIIEQNIDKAQGNTYRARLATAKGEFELAEAAYDRALATVEVNSDLWVKYGQVLVYNKKLNEAESAFKKAVQQKPDNVNAHRGLATVYLQLNRGADALNQIKTARRYAPRSVDILNIYLQLEQQFGNKETATEIREKIATANPTDITNRRALAGLYAEQERFNDAIELAHQLIKDEGENRTNISILAGVYALSGKPDQGETAIRQYIAGLIDKDTIADHLVLARYLTQQNGNIQATLAAYQNAIDIEDAETRVASRELADLLFSRGQYPQAAEIYKAISEGKPDDVRVALRLAETYIKSNNFDKASEVLSKADPDKLEVGVSESLNLQAIILLNQNKSEEAIRLMTQAIRNDRENGRLHYQLARMLSTLPDRTSDAIKSYNNAIQYAPNLMIARRELAALQQRRGRPDEAIRELQNLLSINPKDASARRQLLVVLRDEKKILEAKTVAQEAIELTPEDPRWYSMLGDLEAVNGNYKAAVEAKMVSFDLAPSDQAMTRIGELLFQANRPDKLIEIYDSNNEYSTNILAKAHRGRALVLLNDAESGTKLLDQAFDDCQNFGQLMAISAQVKAALGQEYLFQKLTNQDNAEKAAWGQIIIGETLLSQRDFDQAIELSNSVLPLVTDALKLRALRTIATAHYMKEDFTASKNAYETILEAYPDDLGTLNNLAYLLADDLKTPEPALPLAKRAYELAPQNEQILDTYGWVLFSAGQHEEAKSILEKSVAIKPIAPGYLHLGMAYKELGRLNDAINTLNQAVEFANKNGSEEIAQEANELLKQLGQ
ncbi:tetratricopeptide repeat protein [Planctomycetota bacterium]|nr:tetratricopeptide repeat protein [Planctomycetota bacterium]